MRAAVVTGLEVHTLHELLGEVDEVLDHLDDVVRCTEGTLRDASLTVASVPQKCVWIGPDDS